MYLFLEILRYGWCIDIVSICTSLIFNYGLVYLGLYYVCRFDLGLVLGGRF